MSRAFVREDDSARPEQVPDLPISAAPNLVTRRGLRLIETRIAEAERQLSLNAEETMKARLRRDLRYWYKRHATAQVSLPDPDQAVVQFGSKVTYETDTGEVRTITLTGEDEADPVKGLIPYPAPLARALTGARPGETVMLTLQGRAVELTVLGVEIPDDLG